MRQNESVSSLKNETPLFQNLQTLISLISGVAENMFIFASNLINIVLVTFCKLDKCSITETVANFKCKTIVLILIKSVSKLLQA